MTPLSSPMGIGLRSLTASETPASKRAALSAPPLRLSGSWLAAQGRLPLAFMGLALVWLVAATALLVTHPQVLALPHLHPQVVALTHAWVLGFFVTVACGAVYQLAPVALGTTLANERHGWWHFGLHAAGVPGMVYSFWRWDPTLLGHFGSAVALGIVLFCVNTWRTVQRSGRSNVVAWSLGLGAAWLLLTVAVGLLLAANRLWSFIPLDPVCLLRAHAHVGLIGFFVTLLQGVSFQLLPMFTLGEVRDWQAAKTGLWLSQLGLIGLAAALAWHIGPIAVLSGLTITAGLIFSGFGLSRALATRKKRTFDPGVSSFLRGGAGLGIAAVAGVVLVAPGTLWGSAPGGFNAMVYAILIIFGGLLPCIAGMMCKIVPFLTWMRAYGPRVGRGPTPAASALAHPRIEYWGFILQSAAIAPLLVGTWTLNDRWLACGTWLLALGVVLFAADMLGVLKHLWIASARCVAAAPKPAQ